MSWRHDIEHKAPATRTSHALSRRYNRHLASSDIPQKLQRLLRPEFRIRRLDAKKKAISRCPGKLGNVKDRMVRLRKSIHSEHAYQCGKRGEQNHAFEGNRYISRPTMKRSPTHIVRISDDGHPKQQAVATDHAAYSTD